MRLPAQARVEFQTAYKAAFGVEIDAERADALGVELLDTMCLALAIVHRHRVGLTTSQTNGTMTELGN
jgi:hypothetical protein